MVDRYAFYYDEKGILHPSEKRVKITKCKECGKNDNRIIRGLCKACYRRWLNKKNHTKGYYRNYNK